MPPKSGAWNSCGRSKVGLEALTLVRSNALSVAPPGRMRPSHAVPFRPPLHVAKLQVLRSSFFFFLLHSQDASDISPCLARLISTL